MVSKMLNGGEKSSGYLVDDDPIFGSVPCENEVEHAVAAFQSFMQRLSSSVLGLQQVNQPRLNRKDQRVLQSPVFQRVLDAFRLLQTEPSIQRMIVSISSDKSFWDAVMMNNEVQEFQQSLQQVRFYRPSGSDGADDEPELVCMILQWILDAKLTVMGLIEKLVSVVRKSFQPCRVENTSQKSKYQLEELIGSTVLLSTMTLMMVLVTRVYET